MTTLLDRFIRYVKIDTQSDENSPSSPSTQKQFDLSRVLESECKEMGLENVSLSEHGIVLATLPSTVSHKAPTIAWIAHVDTTSDYSGTNVNPIVHENYQGGDISLPEGDSLVIKFDDELKEVIGHTVITTDGSTLLGADDKSGVAAIMTAVEHLKNHPEIEHGPIRVCFTVDEEIGRGCENIDLTKIDSVCGYTLDSSGCGRIDSETFSADAATVTVRGINTHPSEGKDKLVNAIRLLAKFIDRLPQDHLAPEVTDGRDGFMHPYNIEGDVTEASIKMILRDFETEKLPEQANLLKKIAKEIEAEEPRCKIEVTTRKQYRNMRDGMDKEPRALPLAIEATKAVGLEPFLSIIRGGTDGSILTEMGLPTPNLSSGQHNVHSPLEWTSVEQMQTAADVLVELAKLWGKEKA